MRDRVPEALRRAELEAAEHRRAAESAAWWGTGGALVLLLLGYLGDAAFVALVLGVGVLAFAIWKAPTIIELSVGGAAIKLRTLEDAAARKIRELDEAQLTMFSTLLDLATRLPGGFDTGKPTDARADDFLRLVKRIEAAGLRARLGAEIRAAADVIARGALGKVGSWMGSEHLPSIWPFYTAPERYTLPLLHPTTARAEALAEPAVEEASQRRKQDPAEFAAAMEAAMDSYRRLYEIVQEGNR